MSILSKTVKKYLARGMHDACKNRDFEGIRELYAIGIVPCDDDVRSALRLNDILAEILIYQSKPAAEKYFNEKVLNTFSSLIDCGIDMSAYIVDILGRIRNVDSDLRPKFLEFVIANFDHTSIKSPLTSNAIVDSFACMYRFDWDCEKNYIDFGIFHLLVYNGVSKILNHECMNLILSRLICGNRYSSYSVMISRNKLFSTFVYAIDDDNLFDRFPCKSLLPGYIQPDGVLGIGIRHTVETTFAIDLLITS